MHNNQTKKITWSALFLAIYLVIFMLDHFLGGYLFDFLLALPIALITYQYGWRSGALVWVAATLLTIIINPFLGIYYSLTVIPVGYLYGGLIKRVKHLDLIFISAVLFFFLTSLIAWILFFNLAELGQAETWALCKNFATEIAAVFGKDLVPSAKQLGGGLIVFNLLTIMAVVYADIILYCLILLLTRLNFGEHRLQLYLLRPTLRNSILLILIQAATSLIILLVI